ncbi:ABC transporter permease [Nocardioides sp. AE5]|uniref:ABC transporter permease n=1 Tax=Nocardioides sp. AE5 TaxID=2962573 RepID=UPI0028819550|nr:ABC transporter permease [Nocardioides sp. AE5]MDT0202476.1 ABC transporter permease [Nocardioides sp. AE5]
MAETTVRAPLKWESRGVKAVWVPVGLLILLFVASIFLPLPYDPLRANVGDPLQAPSGEHWFGTDISGFDVFSRTVRAGRLDLSLAFAGALVSAFIGVSAGLYVSKPSRTSDIIMRFLDAFQAFPLLFLGVAVVTLGGAGLEWVVVAIALQNVPRFMRVIRAEAQVIRSKRYFEAAQAMGATNWHLMWRHLLPNVKSPALIQLSLTTANALVIIAALSFLGVGITAPAASWGTMIQSGSQSIATGEWWPILFPALGILTVVMSLNWLADEIERTKAGGVS